MNPAPSVERLLVVGSGGFGREVVQWVHEAWPAHARRLAGFLSADGRTNRVGPGGLAILADPLDYEPRPGDGLLLAIGVPETRRRVAEAVEARGGRFLTLIHPTAVVAATATIGSGSILCPYSIVSDSARVGRHVLVNYHASLGHDASAGDFAVLSPYAALGGHARIEDDVFLGMHASVGPGKVLGARTKVSANSCALAHAPADTIIFGVPGRMTPRVAVEEQARPPRCTPGSTDAR